MTQVDPCIPLALIPPGSKAVVWAEQQPEYAPLPSVVTLDRKVITRWQLTPDEIKRVLDGADIYLTILTFGQPLQPVLLTVGPVDWTLPPAVE